MLYKNTYRLKKLEDLDFPALRELLWKVFYKRSSILELKNKYDASHVALKCVSTIAYKNEIPVAFYGAVLQRFKKNEQEIIVAQACDSATLEGHQGKGLHFQLAKLSYEVMRKQNVSLVYAFLNENSFYSNQKLGWHSHLNMERFHIKTRAIPIAKLINKLEWNGSYSFFFNKKISHDAIQKLKKENNNKFRQVLDDKFIIYKNSLKNHYCIELENCVFWVKIEAIMHVGLSHAPSKVALQKAIKKLKQKAFLLGITEILFQVDPKSLIASQLQNLVVAKESWLIGYFNFDPEIDLKHFIFTYGDLDTF
ncbi:GNAT family N-acetyltransferase [Lacinutrix sp. Hel_I_90]|uniref:GNAT family N-acetyltransferase n=1 Tax=Lacinutrix sp. Hel_I_90 TaxID=1249999 RepID=UPI0005C8F10A|nr:GNAT family N-acetyltransferase [Lacinutrix sp. Hel_I_90]